MVRCLITALLAGSCSLPVWADDAAPKKVALLVGVNQYLKPGFKPLQFAEADVTAVAEELRKLGFSVTVLLGSGSGEAQATQANIEATARKMVAPLGQNDVALVMLSGHGQQLNSDPDAVDLDKSQSYYCPVDAIVNRPETQFSLSHLVDDILAPNVGRKLLLVDACRDIPADRTRGRNTKGIEGRIVSLPEDTAVFFSCRAGQTSFERDELGHGLFTYCVLEGLRGSAVSASGDVAWSALVAHVDRRMSEPDIVKYMPERMRQVPIPSGAMPFTVLGKVAVKATPIQHPSSFTNSIGMKLSLIPHGSFLMGSDPNQLEQVVLLGGNTREDTLDEQPQHHVRISRPFYLGTFEVTKGQFAQFVNDRSYRTDAETDGLGGNGWNRVAQTLDGPTPTYTWRSWGVNQSDSSPVVNVSWNDAVAFCDWLSGMEGTTYRLPTEAEWEYACRSGTSTLWYHGDDAEGVARIGNIADAAARNLFAAKNPEYTFIDPNDDWAFTAPVGQFGANRFGLFDMHGNVWEWCYDWYDVTAYAHRGDITINPVISSSGDDRHVFRGGCWNSQSWVTRSACRSGRPSNYRDFRCGFRVAMTPTR